MVGCSQKFKYIQIHIDSYIIIYFSLLQAVFVGGSTVFAPSTIWLFNISHGKMSHFLIGKPSINGPFSMAMLNNQRVTGRPFLVPPVAEDGKSPLAQAAGAGLLVSWGWRKMADLQIYVELYTICYFSFCDLYMILYHIILYI